MDAEAEDWQNVQSQFLSLYPLKLFKWMKGIVHSARWQKQMLLNTLHHPTACLYHPPLSYSRSFLKSIISKLEDEGTEVVDEIYETYAELMSRKDESDSELCFKTYVIDSTNCVILKESRNLVSNGTTGLCTWQASQYLCEWIADHKGIFRNRVVLELGSGLGLLGLILCKLCQPREVILSDCHDEVIRCLIDNVERNISKQQEEEEEALSERLVSSSEGGHAVIDKRKRPCKPWKGGQLESLVQFNRSNVTVLKLNWETISDESLEALASDVDVIIAADVVYDDSIIPALVRNLSGLLDEFRDNAAANSRPSRKMLFVCSTIRNSTTRDHFLSACREAGLQYEVMCDPVSQIFHYDRSTRIELLRLSR